MIEVVSRLPAEYQEAEYIKSSGTQYIDPDFVPNQDTRIVMNVLFTIQGTNQFLFGSCAEQKSKTYAFNCYSTKYRSHYNAGWLDYATRVSYTTPFVLDKNKNVTTLNGEHTVTETYAAFTCPYSLILFGINDGGTITASAIATLYSCQIYDNGTLVRDFVPCYRKSDSVAGLYDIVNDVFYTNAGSGTFAVGANSNAHSIMTITEGGIITEKSALRRRNMMFKTQDAFAFTYTGDYTDNRDANGKGTVRLKTSGELTVTGKAVTIKVVLLGAGGGAAYQYQTSDTEHIGVSGGGGGVQEVEVTLEQGVYDVVVGVGGAAANSTDATASGKNGGDTVAFNQTSTGGTGGRIASSGTRYPGKGGTPNGKGGTSTWDDSYSASISVAGGLPNGGAVVSNKAQSGDSGYVDLIFS